MTYEKKIQAFEYLLYKLVEWHKIESNGADKNDISILKSLKLLFFVSTVDTNKHSQGTLLDNVFTRFAAMPYGHVELDVYTAIKENDLTNVQINNSKTTIGEDLNFDGLSYEVRAQIDANIIKLRKINPNLVTMNAFDLVELSHLWHSWKHYFAKAKRNYTLRENIPLDIIKAEEKIYFLKN